MEKIRQLALSVSLVSIISGVLISLLPKGKNKEFYKIITTIIIIYVFIQPFTGIQTPDFNIENIRDNNFKVSNNIDQYANSTIISSAESAIETLLLQNFSNEGISCNIKCVCEIKDSKINIVNIIVKDCSNAQEKNVVKEIIANSGFDSAVLRFEGDNN